MRRRYLRLHHDTRGSSLIETTLVLPVLMMVGLGAVEFGNYIYRSHLIWNGVRDAARYASGLPYDPANVTANNARIQNMAVYGSDATGNARVYGWVPANITVSWSNIANPDGACGGSLCYRPPNAAQQDIPLVTVSASYTYQPMGFLGFLGIAGAVTITSAHQERVIGVR